MFWEEKSTFDSLEFNDYTVIVRSVGERTEQKCIERLRLFFKGVDIKVVKGCTPFTAAMRKTFEIGIEDKRRWCLVVDADVLFYDDKLLLFLENCNRIVHKNERAFCFQAYLYDNFFEENRLAGCHLFHTRWLKLAFAYVDNNKGRPESWVIRNMSWQGYPCYVIDSSVGIHDFFQSYRDIVAKGMLHAQKHSNIEQLISKWEENKYYEDYRWILEGVKLIRSVKPDGVKVDAAYYRELIDKSGIIFPAQDELEESEMEKVLNIAHRIEHYYELVVPKEQGAPIPQGWMEWLSMTKKMIREKLNIHGAEQKYKVAR